MNPILNEENRFQADESVRISVEQTSKAAKITGIFAIGLAVLAIISIFVPFLSAFLFWNFLLLSAALGIFGFMEISCGKGWFNNLTWLISLALLFLLFIFAFDSFKNPQSLYFYGAFSIIVPILLTITALIGKKLSLGIALSPLIISVFFIISATFLSSKAFYPALFLLPISMGFLGIVIYLASKD